MHSIPELVVGEWRLRALEHKDAEAWLAVVREPELRRLTSWNVDTLEDMRRNIASYLDGDKASTTRRWAIVDRQDTLCGTVGFKAWSRDARVAEIAYELAREHRGRGVMTAIAQKVMAHGIDEMQLGVMRALVMVENAASIRLLEKLEFTKAETLPAFRTCGGLVRDFYRFERVVR